uniref:(northern house mosquito) hypothetical protein n=1 Tax=Culex pipiens TaxID=7175 RepID=A0A8D8K1K7_CULPI
MDDLAVQQLLQQSLCQQQQPTKELDELDAHTAASQLEAQTPSGDLFVRSREPCSTNSHLTHVDHTEGDSHEAAETRLPRSQAIVRTGELEQEKLHLSSGQTATQPAAKESFNKQSLSSLDDVIIPAEGALSERTDLSVIDPHRPHRSSFAILTRIPETFTPDASHLMVNNKVCGVSQIDDILVVNQVQEQRRDQTQRSCPGRSKHHLNGHVQVGRSVHRFVRGGLKSDESAECFAPTGQQTLEATSSGGKALRATTNSPTWGTTTMLAPDDQLNQQNNTKDFNIFKVLRYAAWAWDPGPLLQRVGLPERHRIICLFSDQLWQHNDDCEGVLSRAEQKLSLDILLGARNLKPAEPGGLNELRQQFQPSSPDRQSSFSADRVHPEAPHLRRSLRLRFTPVYCELHDF